MPARAKRNMRTSGWGDWLRGHRERHGFRHSHLAARVNMDHSYLAMIEREGYVPSPDLVVALARTLGVSSDEALLRAGWAPQGITPEDWGAILCEFRRRNLVPELAAACQLHDLEPAEQRTVAAFLQGCLMAVAS